MKLKAEFWLTIASVGFLLSWLIDKLGGPVNIVVKNPVMFLSSPVLLRTYPFTVTAIIIRALAIFISVMFLTSLIKGKYFTKVIVLFFVGMLAEFFAIQQLATGFRTTTIQWTLSIAYGSLSLILGIAWMVLKGIWSMFNKEEVSKVENKEESVLTPNENSD